MAAYRGLLSTYLQPHARTESALWAALRADRSATILAASHRRAVLAQADRIVVLEDGLMVDQGSLAELLERCAEMRRLWDNASA